MRVVFLGNARWSVPSLEAVASSSHEVVRVVTRVPKPAGRGGALTPTPVALSARRRGLPLAEVETQFFVMYSNAQLCPAAGLG